MGRNNSGSGASGAHHAYSPPIDLYRKQIGRQSSKEKKHLKQMKQHQEEAKEAAPKALKQTVGQTSCLISDLGRKILLKLYFNTQYSMENELRILSYGW